MLSSLTLEIDEPFKIVVENAINTISPYVLLEQETWFEPEVPFLKAFLKPGMRVVDIGTNCGFYTLLAAHIVGGAGHVWGFEPGLKPAQLLKESLRINGYNNVTLYEVAVGQEPGIAWFNDKDMTELSHIVDEGTADARAVKVESLDNLYRAGEITGVDFIKIDAEGFEEQVVHGARTFFENESPLVMMEIISDSAPVTGMGAANTLKAMGYGLYRYYSGAGCLVPLVMDRLGDFVLNIFLCKPDRAALLQQLGLLVTTQDLAQRYEPADPALFIEYFFQLPILKSCPEIQNMMGSGIMNDLGYHGMAAEYLLSQDQSRSAFERFLRLDRADRWVERHFKDDMSFSEILTIMRVWAATGRRPLVAGMLRAIFEGKSGMQFTTQYPFLPLSAKWETVDAREGQFYPWVASMMAETLENYRSFSSLYDDAGIGEAYKLLRQHGYLTEAVERSMALTTLIMGKNQLPDPAYIGGPVKRNRAIWNEIACRLARGEKGIIKLDSGTDLIVHA
jgi:FkbM family methyltransferase